MFRKIFLHLLILCGIFSQGIFETSDEQIGKSPDFLVRKKRVINHEPGGDAVARIEDINYTVNIRHSTRMHCVGAILSRFTVITAALCVLRELLQYEVQSGSPYPNRCINHNITSKATHFGNLPHGRYDGIALIRVNPPFTYRPKTGNIDLHVEPVLPGTLALINGWGCQHPTAPPMGGRCKLRSITLPIMNHRECIASYAGRFEVTNKHICTYDEQKLCATHDIGAPLVIDNSLVGIHIYKSEFPHTRNPDVFIDVQVPEYSVWIRENIQY